MADENKQENKEKEAVENSAGFIVGRKLNMTQYFGENGEVIPVTVVKVETSVITQIKSKDTKDNYNAIQVGFGKKKKLNKSEKGHLKDLGDFANLTEFRVEDAKGFKKGQKISVESFQIGEFVNCVGTSKGRGFAGAMKRHGFKGFPASHGHNRPRSVGSIGQMFPQHVMKGVRMGGHMGNARITEKNLQIVEIDKFKNLMSLKGAIPGHMNGLVKIVSTGVIKPIEKVEEKEEKKKK